MTETPSGESIPAKAIEEEFEHAFHHPLHTAYSSFYLGSGSYGGRVDPRNVPVGTRLTMLTDRRVALGRAFIEMPIINAPYEVKCADPQIKAFVEAVWKPLHESFVRQAAAAIMMGFQPMVQKLAFKKPRPTESQGDEGIDPWTGSSDPLIVTGFDSLHPESAKPSFDDDGEFEGLELGRAPNLAGTDNLIARENSVWVTREKRLVYGSWWGWGRLVTAYESWWNDSFLNDLYMRHCERTIDPPIKVRHPKGYAKDPNNPDKKGRKFSDIALEMGQNLRSGATVSIPSTPYETQEGQIRTERQWSVDVLDAGNIDAFEKTLTRHEADVLMGLLIPPAALSSKYAKETLGGKSMVEVLGQLATKMIYADWSMLAANAQTWTLDRLVEWNFGPNAPQARIETEGFREKDKVLLTEIIKLLIKVGAIDTELIDDRETIQAAGIPMQESGGETDQGDSEGKMSRLQEGDVLYEGDDVTITEQDVLDAVREATERGNEDMASLMMAQEWEE